MRRSLPKVDHQQKPRRLIRVVRRRKRLNQRLPASLRPTVRKLRARPSKAVIERQSPREQRYDHFERFRVNGSRFSRTAIRPNTSSIPHHILD